jgi:hypothetical protein
MFFRMFLSPGRLCIFLVGFFMGGWFPTLATAASSYVRFILVCLLLRVAECGLPAFLSVGRAGFIFGLFVEAFKVGS